MEASSEPSSAGSSAASGAVSSPDRNPADSTCSKPFSLPWWLLSPPSQSDQIKRKVVNTRPIYLQTKQKSPYQASSWLSPAKITATHSTPLSSFKKNNLYSSLNSPVVLLLNPWWRRRNETGQIVDSLCLYSPFGLDRNWVCVKFGPSDTF